MPIIGNINVDITQAGGNFYCPSFMFNIHYLSKAHIFLSPHTNLFPWHIPCVLVSDASHFSMIFLIEKKLSDFAQTAVWM